MEHTITLSLEELIQLALNNLIENGELPKKYIGIGYQSYQFTNGDIKIKFT